LARPAALALLGWGLAACTNAQEATPPPTPTEPREPVPWLPDLEVEPTAPTLSGDEVGAAIEQRFASLVTAVPTGFPDALVGLVALAEDGCPGEIIDETVGSRRTIVLRADGCETRSGTAFSGSIDLAWETGTVDDDGNDVDGAEWFAQDLRIEAPDGRFVEADGYFNFRHTFEKRSAYASSYCTGRLRADDATAGDDPWLRGDVEGLVSVFVGDFNGYRLASVEATVATDDPEIVGISLQDLRWEPGQCDIELLGAGSIREASGVWHDVVFATRDEETEEVFECDGCGAHQAAGAPQEEPVCNSDALDTLVDFSGGLPW